MQVQYKALLKESFSVKAIYILVVHTVGACPHNRRLRPRRRQAAGRICLNMHAKHFLANKVIVYPSFRRTGSWAGGCRPSLCSKAAPQPWPAGLTRPVHSRCLREIALHKLKARDS